jgi:hypothetical protein
MLRLRSHAALLAASMARSRLRASVACPGSRYMQPARPLSQIDYGDGDEGDLEQLHADEVRVCSRRAASFSERPDSSSVRQAAYRCMARSTHPHKLHLHASVQAGDQAAAGGDSADNAKEGGSAGGAGSPAPAANGAGGSDAKPGAAGEPTEPAAAPRGSGEGGAGPQLGAAAGGGAAVADEKDPMKLPPHGTELFVANIPHEAGEDEIRAFIAAAGLKVGPRGSGPRRVLGSIHTGGAAAARARAHALNARLTSPRAWAAARMRRPPLEAAAQPCGAHATLYPGPDSLPPPSPAPQVHSVRVPRPPHGAPSSSRNKG